MGIDDHVQFINNCGISGDFNITGDPYKFMQNYCKKYKVYLMQPQDSLVIFFWLVSYKHKHVEKYYRQTLEESYPYLYKQIGKLNANDL